MKIESIRVKNYRVFQDVKVEKIPSMSVFIGVNGSGKSTFFDIFAFLRDSLTHNVRQALSKRGGFKEVISRGKKGPIEIEIKFRDEGPLVTYFLAIGLQKGSPVVESEILRYRRGKWGRPWHFLNFELGKGYAITNEEDYGKEDGKEEKRDYQELGSPDILAIKGLGQFQRFKVVSSFRKLIENWHVSDFHISEARTSQEAGVSEHLSSRGENLALVAQYIYENHLSLFKSILKKMPLRVPGISNVEAVETEDGRIVLKFQDGSFKDPFIAKYVSDGTIKMFAYLLLLHDPHPHPLLCVEEPENQLYPRLLEELAEEFRSYSGEDQQVFISTHSPDFLNAAGLDEVFFLKKENGFTTIEKAGRIQLLQDLVKEGDLLGALWKQRLFDGVDPS